MAIPTVRSIGTGASGSGDISPGIPAGYADDDIAVMFVEHRVGNTASPPTGWTEETNSPIESGVALDTKLAVFWHRRAGSDPSTTVTDPGNHAIGRIIAITGCITTGDPFDVSVSSGDATVDASGVIPGPTTSVVDTLVLAALTIQYDANSSTVFSGWTNANLSSVTEQIDMANNPNVGGAIGVASGGKATAGAVGNTTVTIDAGSFSKAYWAGALKPPAAAGAQALTGTTFTKAPTFPTGAISATYALTGTVYQLAPTFPTGTITAGAVALTGTTFTKAPTFPTGIVQLVGAPQALTGSVYQLAPTFPTGTLSATYALTGTTYQLAPTFPTGTITAGTVALTGIVYALAPTFPTGTITGAAVGRSIEAKIGSSTYLEAKIT